MGRRELRIDIDDVANIEAVENDQNDRMANQGNALGRQVNSQHETHGDGLEGHEIMAEGAGQAQPDQGAEFRPATTVVGQATGRHPQHHRPDQQAQRIGARVLRHVEPIARADHEARGQKPRIQPHDPAQAKDHDQRGAAGGHRAIAAQRRIAVAEDERVEVGRKIINRWMKISQDPTENMGRIVIRFDDPSGEQLIVPEAGVAQADESADQPDNHGKTDQDREQAARRELHRFMTVTLRR